MTCVSYAIAGGDYEHGGSASRRVKEQLKRVGADPAAIRRAMIAAYEAEMNVVIHARRGELRAALSNGQLDVEIIDEGPGIADVEQALRPGFSTAPPAARELGFGAGMGLPNIRRNSDRFAITSTVGQGTHVSFSIRLAPQIGERPGRNSLRIAAERCRASMRCLHACPTRALRVVGGRPDVLDHLCIDCAACLAVCPSATLGVDAPDVALPLPATTLLVPPPLLAQFGAEAPPRRVVAELQALGFAEICVTAGWERALADAVVARARAADADRPVISPACPAAINLVALRFPALLPNVAPLAAPLEAALAACGERPVAAVALCPAQCTMLLESGNGQRPVVLLPAVLRAALLPRLAMPAARPEEPGTPPVGTDIGRGGAPAPLRITGTRGVLSALEQIESGELSDVAAIEPYMCDGGCFGSPLLTENAEVARFRWERAPVSAETGGTAPRRVPLAPRPGLRLDADMRQAIAKLARIDQLTRELPGSDCGECGAPTCAALAEDVALGRNTIDACTRRHRTVGAAAPRTAPAQEKSP